MSTTTNLGRVGMVLRGEYSASTQYAQLDVVTYEGSAYAAKKNVKGVAPTDTASWQMLADARGAIQAAETANTAASNADAKAAAAVTATNTAIASAKACDEAVAALPDQVTDVFASLGLTMVDGKLCMEVERA